MNCFRRRDISRYDASRNLKSTCTLGLLSSEPREPWDCHVKQGSWPTRRCSAAWSKDELLQLRCHLHPSRPINLPTARHLSEGIFDHQGSNRLNQARSTSHWPTKLPENSNICCFRPPSLGLICPVSKAHWYRKPRDHMNWKDDSNWLTFLKGNSGCSVDNMFLGGGANNGNRAVRRLLPQSTERFPVLFQGDGRSLLTQRDIEYIYKIVWGKIDFEGLLLPTPPPGRKTVKNSEMRTRLVTDFSREVYRILEDNRSMPSNFKWKLFWT